VSVASTIRVKESRRIKWVEHQACMLEVRHDYKVLVGKPEGKITYSF
jgi:hypothetical protein